MKPVARNRTHSIGFKRQVAQDRLAGETLHGLAKRHDLSRHLIRVWVQKYEAGALDDRHRLHSALGYPSPKQFEDQHARRTVKPAAWSLPPEGRTPGEGLVLADDVSRSSAFRRARFVRQDAKLECQPAQPDLTKPLLCRPTCRILVGHGTVP